MRCAPLPRAWKWAEELSAKTMRPGWLAWAAFVLRAGFRSRISGLETVGSQGREGTVLGRARMPALRCGLGR